MEEKNRTTTLRAGLVDPALWVGLFAAIYLAVLPMADTIALRNVALLAVLICLAWQFPKIRLELKFGLPIALWAVYLLIFPLIADDHLVAWQNLGSQWGRGLLAMLAGAGVAALLVRRVSGVAFYLGAISAVPILVHLSLLAWKALETGAIPWGYWGRETHHADLGYAAGHTVILMAVTIIAANRKFRFWAIAFLVAALLSTVLARSRAGLVFAVLGCALVFITTYLVRASQQRRHVLIGLAVLTVAGLAFAVFAFKEDSRWRNMTTQLSAGFLGNAIQVQCEGIDSIRPEIESKFGTGENAEVAIYGVRVADGTRVLVLRAGLELAWKHPWGSDGSRQGFQKLLREECPDPVISIPHAHNGWLDTMLAIGWIGAVLYLCVLLYFFRQGVESLRRENRLHEWGLVLVALSVFWIFRGLTDSVFRDHMLEMQGFVLSFALIALKSRKQSG